VTATDLDGRIALILSRSKALPDDVAALLSEVEAALTKTGDELARAREKALDPTSVNSAIASARGIVFEAEFREARLVVARDRLGEKHAAAVERVAKEAREAEHAEISAERDAVSAKLSEVYARAAAEISDVLAAAVQSTRRVQTWNASGVGPWIAEPLQLHKGVRLPALGAGEAAYWPPLEKLDMTVLVPPEMAKREAAIAAEAAEATEIASRREEANRLARGARRKVLAGSWG
jgi:hypothetical protein